MINLLPEEYRKNIRREYRLRFIALTSLFTVCAIVVGIIALVPNIFSIGTEYYLSGSHNKTSDTSDEQKKDQEILKQFKDFNSTLIALDPRKEGKEVLFSDLLRLVVQQKPDRVRLNSFSFITESEATKRLVVSGFARDRESLVAFSKRLSDNNTFSQVDLPISNLSKKENIDFSITLSIKTKKE